MFSKTLRSLSVAGLVFASVSAQAAGQVNVYSYRQPFLIEPLFEEFTKDTGIEVNVVFAKQGLAERLEREGRLSPADLVLTTDISRLMELVEKDLSQQVENTEINNFIPAQYRDPEGHWFALTKRARTIFTTRREGQPEEITYGDLADPKNKGKICTRSGKDAYNVGLVASHVANYGEESTREWLEGFKENLARRPQGNDRAQVRAVQEGVCDIAIGNSYYYGQMLKDEEQRSWAESVYINFPDQKGKGTHINVSGMVLTKHAPNKEGAIKLMAFLASDKAQATYAEVNFEYPISNTVEWDETVASWGTFKEDDLPVYKLAENYSTAQRLLDEVRFDL